MLRKAAPGAFSLVLTVRGEEGGGRELPPCTAGGALSALYHTSGNRDADTHMVRLIRAKP